MARQALPWPREARKYYIKFFRLQERLRAHLKLVQEAALKKRLIGLKADLSPGGTLASIYDFLPIMAEVLEEIVDIRKEQMDAAMAVGNNRTGRHPNWYILTLELAKLTSDIAELVPQIEHDTGKMLDVAVIRKTAKALGIAYQIREKQLNLPLDRAKIGLDEYGLETIIDLSPVQHILDLNSWQLHTTTIRNTK